MGQGSHDAGHIHASVEFVATSVGGLAVMNKTLNVTRVEKVTDGLWRIVLDPIDQIDPTERTVKAVSNALGTFASGRDTVPDTDQNVYVETWNLVAGVPTAADTGAKIVVEVVRVWPLPQVT